MYMTVKTVTFGISSPDAFFVHNSFDHIQTLALHQKTDSQDGDIPRNTQKM